MAGIKISALPAVVTPTFNDLIAEVQPAIGGTTYKATLQQIFNLFNSSNGWIGSVVNVFTPSQAIALNTAYVTNCSASMVTYTLPMIAPVGSLFGVQGSSALGWKIEQNAGQILHVGLGASSAGTGGSISSSNRYDSVLFMCIVENTEWATFQGPQGNLIAT